MAKQKTKKTIDTITALGLLAQRALINDQIADVDLKPVMTAGLAPIFEEYPQLKTIGWKQYAPSFNDGDPCYFTVHNDDDSVELNGVNGYGDDDDEEDEDGERKAIDEKVREKIIAKVGVVFRQFTDGDYQTMFGEGARVTIHRDGTVDSDEYGDY
jgi:hypothetical protein